MYFSKKMFHIVMIMLLVSSTCMHSFYVLRKGRQLLSSLSKGQKTGLAFCAFAVFCYVFKKYKDNEVATGRDLLERRRKFLQASTARSEAAAKRHHEVTVIVVTSMHNRFKEKYKNYGNFTNQCTSASCNCARHTAMLRLAQAPAHNDRCQCGCPSDAT